MRLALLVLLCLSLSGLQGKQNDVMRGEPSQAPLIDEHVDKRGNWKVLFKNGTIITGVGIPPKVWHVIEPKEKNWLTKDKGVKDNTGMDKTGKCFGVL